MLKTDPGIWKTQNCQSTWFVANVFKKTFTATFGQLSTYYIDKHDDLGSNLKVSGDTDIAF